MKVRLEWEPCDLWIGAYWKKRYGQQQVYFDLWICLIPMLPLHLEWQKEH
jgi:hypothetical protein